LWLSGRLSARSCRYYGNGRVPLYRRITAIQKTQIGTQLTSWNFKLAGDSRSGKCAVNFGSAIDFNLILLRVYRRPLFRGNSKVNPLRHEFLYRDKTAAVELAFAGSGRYLANFYPAGFQQSFRRDGRYLNAESSWRKLTVANA